MSQVQPQACANNRELFNRRNSQMGQHQVTRNQQKRRITIQRNPVPLHYAEQIQQQEPIPQPSATNQPTTTTEVLTAPIIPEPTDQPVVNNQPTTLQPPTCCSLNGLQQLNNQKNLMLRVQHRAMLLPYSQRTVWSRPLTQKSSHPSSPSGEDCRIISHCDQRSSFQSPMPNLRIPFFNEGKLHHSRKIDPLLP
ncbi:Hypothetical_protein [Hexamita inflata]|uniref:Hypothetical_protein n=1 Tax=Hexamita inflata TaxID=28002 RepID=A0AA86P4I7_9EUKA|nr:Hypothetical protein HINF_LOCUS18191 [Hexamita inflata]